MDSLSLLLAGGISVPLPVPEGRKKYGWVAGTIILWGESLPGKEKDIDSHQTYQINL